MPQPSHYKKPDSKDNEWSLEWAKYIWESCKVNDSYIPYFQQSKFISLDDYFECRQSIDKYKKIYCENYGIDEGILSDVDGDWFKNKKRRTAIDFSILPVFRKFAYSLLGQLNNVDFDIQAECIDEVSGAEKEQAKWELWFESVFSERINALNTILEMPTNPEETLPDSQSKLQLYSDAGYFKLGREIFGEKIISDAFKTGKWDEYIRQRVTEDIIKYNMACVREVWDYNLEKYIPRYVNPKNIGYEYSDDNDCSNSTWFFEIRYYTITDIMQYGISEEQAIKLADKNTGRYGNPTNIKTNTKNFSNTYGSMLIPVMEFEIKTIDRYINTEISFEDGIKDVVEGVFHKSKGVKYKKEHYNDNTVWRQGKWILDTEIVFDCGLLNDNASRGKNHSKPTFHIGKLPGISIVESAMPILDRIQFTWLRFQNDMNKAAPAGVAVEWSALTGMSIGGKTEPEDIMMLRYTDGNIFYNMQMGIDGVKTNNSGKPISPLPNEIVGVLNDYERAFNLLLYLLRESTGIPSVADASSPTPNTSVRGSEMALSSFNATLRPLINTYLYLKQDVADNIALRVQKMIKYNPDVAKKYARIVGDASIMSATIGNEIANSEFGIKMVAKPTDQELKDTEIALQTALSNGKNGQATLTPGQYLLIKRMISSTGSFKYAGELLNVFTKEAESRIDKNAMQMEQMKTQALEAKSASDFERSKGLISHEYQEKLKYELALFNGKGIPEKMMDNEYEKSNNQGNEIEDNNEMESVDVPEQYQRSFSNSPV